MADWSNRDYLGRNHFDPVMERCRQICAADHASRYAGSEPSFGSRSESFVMEVRNILEEQEARLVSEFDQKLGVAVQTLTAKLDAMMEEIRLLPGGADYVAAMQRLHGIQNPNVLTGGATSADT